MEIATARERNELLGVGPELLGLGFRGHHPAMGEETRDHVPEHGASVRGRAGELPSLGAVPHYWPSLAAAGCGPGGVPARTTRTSPSASSNAIPKLSPSRWRRSEISVSAFSPTFLTLRRSSSLNSTRSRRVRMFEFLSELSERTERPKSSIRRPRRCFRL